MLYHRVRIVDEAGRDVAAGEPGEIWIRGRSVMQGYWENPQATREAFRDGWFRNGDLGLFDQQGYLHIVGRIKDIIIVGSSNVYPSDLEAVLDECADIREAAVVGRRDDTLGEVPVACVVPVPGRSLTTAQVIALFDGRLATYKHPRDVIFLDALPRNATGKVQKTILRDLCADQLEVTRRESSAKRRSPTSATAPARIDARLGLDDDARVGSGSMFGLPAGRGTRCAGGCGIAIWEWTLRSGRTCTSSPGRACASRSRRRAAPKR